MLWIKQVNSPPSWETCTRISEANRDDFMEGGSIRFRLPTISIHLVDLPTISNQFSDNFRFFRHDLCHTYQRGFERGREEFTPWVIMITRYSQTMDWKPMFWVHTACQFLWQSIRPWWCFVYLSELLSDSVVPDPSWTPYSLTCGSPELHFPVKNIPVLNLWHIYTRKNLTHNLWQVCETSRQQIVFVLLAPSWTSQKNVWQLVIIKFQTVRQLP